MNTAELVLGLVGSRGQGGGKPEGVMDLGAEREPEAFARVFARAVERARGDERPNRAGAAPAKRTTPSKAPGTDGGDEADAAPMPVGLTETNADEAGAEVRSVVKAIVRELAAELKVRLSGEGKGEIPEEQLIAILMELLAILLTGTGKGDEARVLEFFENFEWTPGEESPEVRLAVTVEESSRLAEILGRMAEAGEGEGEGEGEKLTLLLNLSENEALAVPLEAGDITLEPDGSSGGEAEAAVIRLRIDAQSIIEARIVAIAASESSPEAQLLVTLPEGSIENATKGLDEETVLAVRLLAPLSEESTKPRAGTVRAPFEARAKDEAAAGDVRSLSPALRDFLRALLQKARGDETPQARADVRTADGMYLNSDDYLRALEISAFLQGVAGKSKDKTLSERLALLLGAADEERLPLSELLFGPERASDRLVSSLLEDVKAQEKERWEGRFFDARGDRFGTAERSARSLASVSEQVPFLPRTPAESFALSNAVDRAAQAAARPSPSLQQDVVNQVVQRVSYAFFNGGEGEIRVFLRPESLGDIHLKVRVEHEVMVAKFVAQSQEVKAIIENNLSQLRDALEQQGIKVAKMVVTLNNGASQEQPASHWNQPYGNASANPLSEDVPAEYQGSPYGVEMETFYGRTELYAAVTGTVNYLA
ncbi:MAG: flagellar hook-length control protein FliK [bacterium]